MRQIFRVEDFKVYFKITITINYLKFFKKYDIIYIENKKRNKINRGN